TIEGSQAVNGESQVYEWNIQHRTGRYERRPDESLMLTGDGNLVEVNAVVQYSVASAEDYLFATTDPANFIRVASESIIRSLVGGVSLDRVLTAGRLEIEQYAEELIGSTAEAHPAGIRVVPVQLQNVHPPAELVPAFPRVSTALAEKHN